MSDKDEALRLANSLAAHSLSRHGQTQAAACLRRQHAEIATLSSALDKLRLAWSREVHGLMADKDRLRAERDALRAHLRYWIPDETMIPAGHEAAWESARAAIDAAKEAK